MHKLSQHQYGGSAARRHVAAAMALAAASLGLVAVTGTAATAGRPATVPLNPPPPDSSYTCKTHRSRYPLCLGHDRGPRPRSERHHLRQRG